MYSELDLYYLEQLGIRPWITKANSLTLQNTLTEAQASLYPLVILNQSDFDPKEQILFQRMMNFLILGSHEILVLNTSDKSGQDYINQVVSANPLAVLALGLDDLDNLELNCPVFTCNAPGYLINHPLEKKNMFRILDSINKLVSTCSN